MVDIIDRAEDTSSNQILVAITTVMMQEVLCTLRHTKIIELSSILVNQMCPLTTSRVYSVFVDTEGE